MPYFRAMARKQPAKESALDFDPGDDGAVVWEEAARQRVILAIRNPVFDKQNGTISLWTGHDHHFDSTLEEFENLDSLYSVLAEAAEEGWYEFVP